MDPALQVKTDADWLREATHAAVDAARKVIEGGHINGRAMISSLSEIEWGWIVCAAIFGWVETRAKQATEEGHSAEVTIRTMSNRDPAPWESGAIATILPGLGDIDGLNWNLPLGDWSKDQIIRLAWSIYRMSNAAITAQHEGATDKITRFCREVAEREHSAANGSALMAHNETREEIPF